MTGQAWFTRLVLPVLATGCVATTAKAELVTTFIGTAPSQQVNVSATKDGVTRSFETPVGPFNFVVLSDTSNTGLAPSFRSFCGDFFQDVALGNDYTFTPGALIDLPDVNSAVQVRKITELYDRFYDVATDAEKGGAFQLALWEILYDANNTDLSNGNFTAGGPGNPSSVPLAQSWLNLIGDDSIPDPERKYTLTALLSPSAQDQIVPTADPVPAPAGVVLLVIGAAGLIARRRFAAKKAAESETVESTEEAKA